jgi:hypothetical protein
MLPPKNTGDRNAELSPIEWLGVIAVGVVFALFLFYTL